MSTNNLSSPNVVKSPVELIAEVDQALTPMNDLWKTEEDPVKKAQLIFEINKLLDARIKLMARRDAKPVNIQPLIQSVLSF